ncbi:ADP-ribose pyrophosphatase YjhB (NUDIX family) [Actinoplanes lutulentus]|uniref:ADP-ribose pyrophosphatase YjhB (NUDIX family) n=1 Tax=Actinoplanes lutulentus TaxID=1287878 RepID=A0A327ZM31_9ACTN|nr:NUDIX domain-containing protein [Actinoplanes lutulentus]MBB2945472.1 ADP-ribose pyrophosphatase YjhB (NUDIX family) [Actinoplanes lutulentus]RAK40397.1 ADP-ribose pyrophosphatase YjhB (NUDIX family) [Actinoplanes lutulentus]
MKIRRRAAAYGVCRDTGGRVLLTRGSDASAFPGLWSLPGGGIDHGEHPDDTVVREFAEESGLAVRIAGVRSATADLARLPDDSIEHTDRIIYDVEVIGGELRPEADGTSDLAAWVAPDDVPLLPFTADVLGVPFEAYVVDLPVMSRERPPGPVQRFGAYALASDPDGRILLTRISDGYPGGGLWHLPGGGTDLGETPEQGLARELFEETSQRGRVVGLLGTSHRYDPSALGPEGVPIDWHVIRVLYEVRVDEPTAAAVTEGAGGSTSEAAWFTPDQVAGLSLTELSRDALARKG